MTANTAKNLPSPSSSESSPAPPATSSSMPSSPRRARTGTTASIGIQDHGDKQAVRFRNIWARRLDLTEEPVQ